MKVGLQGRSHLRPIAISLKAGNAVDGESLRKLLILRRDNKGCKLCVRLILVQKLLLYHNHGHPGGPKLAALVHRRYCFSLLGKDFYQECIDIC